jgi:hypothetical protein
MVFSTLPVKRNFGTMKKYFLLRNNIESGPYQLEELAALPLCFLDLVWIDGESLSWKYATETEELKTFVRDVEKLSGNEKPGFCEQQKTIEAKEDFSGSSSIKSIAQKTAFTNAFTPAEQDSLKSLGSVWPKRRFFPVSELKIAGVFLGLACSALLIKTIADGIYPDVLSTRGENFIPSAALSGEHARASDYQDALVKEVVPVLIDSANGKEPEKQGPALIKDQVKVSINKYKVGLVGGITGLRLTAFNTSAQLITKLIVEIRYLNQDGEVVEKEKAEFASISPGGFKTISLSRSSRGMKVEYGITAVYSRQFSKVQKQA